MSAAPAANRTPGGSVWPWLILALVIIVADQWTKALILANYQYGDQTFITSFFNIVRAHNTGAAFSFLASESGWQRWLFTAIGVGAAIFIVWMMHRYAGQTLFMLAMALILGGAIGNVVDRTMHGYVVDFLDFHWSGRHFPAFNLADSAISLGAVLLIFDELRRMRRGSTSSA
ncbi:signal peptidase II [Variovorax dokdonensis]|uniref:Lipoprotein signal peptidase n=1 Tax=Variovorax dokdonensis TaxID=344883 RepID=A0ABT7N6A3_9BURK|nr:signal peptidase II [Variovorax dokdonensis]MDM0043467.1 signal peptidase II [Variovorax dokdonensis]